MTTRSRTTFHCRRCARQIETFGNTMKLRIHITLLCTALGARGAITADEAKNNPIVTVEPFEPSAECFDITNKFRQPQMVVAPQIEWPSVQHHGLSRTLSCWFTSTRLVVKRLSVLGFR